MGTNSVRCRLAPEEEQNLSVPPGFLSQSSFLLKRVENNDETENSSNFLNRPKYQMEVQPGLSDVQMINKSRKQRIWMLFTQSSYSSVEADSEETHKELPLQPQLPKGVIFGCPDCKDCLKVIAKWHPEEGRIDFLKEAPVFHPTEEEFEDTLQYIASIQSKAEPYGICRIVPPLSWKHTQLMEKEIWGSSTFVSFTQRIDGLKQYPKSKLAESSRRMDYGGRRLRKGVMNDFYCRPSVNPDENSGIIEGLRGKCGPEVTLKSFKHLADTFKAQYFRMGHEVPGMNSDSRVSQELGEPSVQNVVGEYRRIVENPTEEIEVLCGCNLDTVKFNSGFPTPSSLSEKSDHCNHMNSGWNLSKLPMLPGSLLPFESVNTCPILLPRLSVGMCFSTRCWQVEEHYLPLLCYLHLGGPKIWYSVPRRFSVKYEAVMKLRFPELFVEQNGQYHGPFKQLSAATLKSEGVPVYRCVQNPGEFVLVLSEAYYSGFDCGFSLAEEANFAPLDWLPHGQKAVELYSVDCRETAVSYDKLLVGAVMEAAKAQFEVLFCRKNTSENSRWQDACGKAGILTKQFKSRIRSEGNRRKYLCSASQMRKMDKNFDADVKRECSICQCDLHLSAACCSCQADRYSCLNHATKLCSCPWSNKIFLVRHEMSELDLLAQALEGKLSAIYKLSKESLGLAGATLSPRTSLQQLGDEDGSPSGTEQTSQGGETPRCSSVARVKAELKARLLQKKTGCEPKVKENAPECEYAVRANGSCSSASEAKARTEEEQPETTSLKEVNGVNSAELSSATPSANHKSSQGALMYDISSGSSDTSISSESDEELSGLSFRVNQKKEVVLDSNSSIPTFQQRKLRLRHVERRNKKAAARTGKRKTPAAET